MEKPIIPISVFTRELLEKMYHEVEANKDKHKNRRRPA